MNNQHRRIKGYRELSQAEIDLMNQIKAPGATFGELVERLRALSSISAGLPSAPRTCRPA